MTFTILRRVVASALLFSSSIAFSDQSLCTAPEETVFSCSTERGKVVSVCARPNDTGGGIISYRFGSPEKNELEITADTSDENQTLEFSENNWARAYAYSVGFKKDKYMYVVESRWDGCPFSPSDESCSEDSEFQGVVVYKSEKVVNRRRCGAPTNFKHEILSRFHAHQISSE